MPGTPQPRLSPLLWGGFPPLGGAGRCAVYGRGCRSPGERALVGAAAGPPTPRVWCRRRGCSWRLTGPHALSSPRALYTYEDESDDLKLAASGGGGLQELAGRFENQKVMYGFCSVKEPQAALPKYVLVNWVGEDVADARKCACASHVAKIAEFFQVSGGGSGLIGVQ
uniref:Drebrin n=1 Tax=Terrapene triunguis TaxID=2587831 RepID=A0A674IQX0_9SAUR